MRLVAPGDRDATERRGFAFLAGIATLRSSTGPRTSHIDVAYHFHISAARHPLAFEAAPSGWSPRRGLAGAILVHVRRSRLKLRSTQQRGRVRLRPRCAVQPGRERSLRPPFVRCREGHGHLLRHVHMYVSGAPPCAPSTPLIERFGCAAPGQPWPPAVAQRDTGIARTACRWPGTAGPAPARKQRADPYRR